MHYVELKLGDVLPNPYRELGNKPFRHLMKHFEEYDYHLESKRIAELRQSIEATGFWKNIIVRVNEKGRHEIAYGHHRLMAAIEELGVNHVQPFVIEDIGDWQMIQIMGSENAESWGMPNQHANLCVRKAREYLDQKLDECKTVEEFTAEVAFSSKFFNGISKRYGKTRTHGAGRELIQAALGGVFAKGYAVQQALAQIGDSPKQRKLKMEKLEQHREQAHREKEKARNAARKADEQLRKEKEKAAAAEAEEARKLELATEQDRFYDEKAGEVFERPGHAEAFRKAVCQPNIMEYLPRSRLVEFAGKVKEHIGENQLSSAKISSTVSSLFKTFLKREDQKRAKVDHTFAVRERVRRIQRDVSSVSNNLEELLSFVRETNTPILHDEKLQRLHDSTRRYMQLYVEMCEMLGDTKEEIQRRLTR